ncbi:hypothetical protein ERO13_A12G081800v2 [Gossypium hirsutum]|uniref:Transcription factor bHLH19 n=1 Tax=Gossypium hirsutum TaxID=3635 RepID=A0A1U8M4G1_GOSHI|nr:transcription factor bHLH19-like [Gossypium hirsutum]KAG4169470.1 hypothetical protein ERO13_A12G081800v2 [Gossypium hirsutum]
MEIASGKWLSQLEMEDPTLFPQYQVINPIDYSFHDVNFHSENYSTNPYYTIGNSFIEASHEVDDFKRPMKQLKTNSWNSCITENNIPPPPKPSSSSSSSHLISFDNSNSYYAIDYDVKPKNEVGSFTRTPLHAQDHVLAERKRRAKLSQSFISLSALIPGLKKTDKASVLGDAITYLKKLQDRVNVLEEQVAKKTMESVIFVRKTQIYADDETSSSDESVHGQSNNPFPEIEARVSDKDVLIRIHCKHNKGCISNIINEVEKLHLFVLNSHVLPFGQATLDITITAQMEAEFSMTAKDLVKSLRLALLKFIM